nr:helix-turn-helix domain-containing protein [Acetobacter persici]
MLSSGHYQILSTLSRHGAQSRTELAQELGLSKAAISALVRDLLDRDILSEQDLFTGRADLLYRWWCGRMPHGLSVFPFRMIRRLWC